MSGLRITSRDKRNVATSFLSRNGWGGICKSPAINYPVKIPPSRMGKKGQGHSIKSFFDPKKTATKIPTTLDEDTASMSFSSDEDVATVPGPPTPNWYRAKAKDPPEVFEAVVNDDDLKPPARRTVLPPAPLPLDWTRLGKSPDLDGLVGHA